jgi:hypothetical protein
MADSLAEGTEQDMAAGLLPHQCHPPSPPVPALAPTAPGSPHAPNPLPHLRAPRDTIAKRMHMIHVDQPLMLMELLGRGLARQQPARPLLRTWPAGSWAKT